MYPLSDSQLASLLELFMSAVDRTHWKEIVIGYQALAKSYVELRKEHEAVNGMLVDLQDHSNLYHKGLADGEAKGTAVERKRCAKLVADSRWQMLVKGGLSTVDGDPRLIALEKEIKGE